MESGPLATFLRNLPLFVFIFACLALVPHAKAAAESPAAYQTAAAPLALNCSPASGPGMVGQFYVASCNGTGGVPPYSWALANFQSCGSLCAYYGQLPAGIGWNSSGSTAQFSGTPTSSGPYLYGPQLTDSAGTSVTYVFSGNVTGAPLTLSCLPTTGPTAVGTAYTATCTASGGVPLYTWSIPTGIGSLPTGLSLNANSGAVATISGTPTGAGGLGYSYIVQVVDSTTASATQTYSGALTQTSQPLAITSLVPPNAVAGGPGFTLTVIGTGFAAGAVVNWGSTSLPTSYLGPTQLTAQVPASLVATAGTASITVTSPTATGTANSKAITFTITQNPALLETMSCTPSTGPAAEGVTYLANCTVSGGVSPYTWSISAGALPQGLATSANTGIAIAISGTPTSTGPYNYTVKVVDSSPTPRAQSQSYSGTITLPPAAITSLTCSNGSNGPSAVGVRYVDTCTAPNGLGPFNWSISAGALPAGLTLNSSAASTATVSGTPTAAGPFSYTLQVSDSTSPAPLSGSQVFSGSIGAAGSPELTISPPSVSFLYRPDLGLPAAQSVSLFTTGSPSGFTVSVSGSWLSSTPLGGQTPGSLSLSANVGGLSPGTYSGQVTVTALSISPTSVTIPVTLVIQTVPAPQLTLAQGQLAFGLAQGSAPVQGQLLVTNSGGGVLNFTTAVTGCSCVTVSTLSGQATPGSPAAVAYTVNPTGLPPSTYYSQIVISASNGQQVTVPVTLAVNSSTQSIVLTQSGLLFGTVAQGAAPPSQSFGIFNAGQGSMSFSVTTQTLSGTAGWLTASPSSGSVAAGSILTPVTVSVNPGSLPVGQYYGLVEVTAPNAGNSPQVVSVLLNIVDPSQGAVLVSPLGEVAGSVNGTNITGPVTIYNLSNQALGYSSTVSTTDGGNWLTVTPASGTVPAAGSVQVTIGASGPALPSGTGQGVVRLGFSNGIVQSVAVTSLSVPVTSSAGLQPDAQGGCTTSSLVPTLRTLGPAFSVTQSQPQTLTIAVVDNCDNPAPGAAVAVSFSSGDKLSQSLANQGNGVWTGTWVPKTPGAQVTLSVVALEEQGLTFSSGLLQLNGTVQSAASTDAPAPAAALNSANVSGSAQISPGSWVTILGDRLANGTQSASGTFPSMLVGTTVMIGSTALPLDYAGPSQVNALLPFSLTPNASVSLTVQRAGTVSVPIEVTIADVGPAIFATNGGGTGQGAVLIASSGVLAAPVGAFPGSQPVARGDYLSLYCTGLGAVTNTPADGAPAPSSAPLATTLATPTVTIGGVPATVTYSGLAPGLVGLYQVNVQVPASALSGSAVNLAISVGSLTSNTVTIAVQ